MWQYPFFVVFWLKKKVRKSFNKEASSILSIPRESVSNFISSKRDSIATLSAIEMHQKFYISSPQVLVFEDIVVP